MKTTRTIIDLTHALSPDIPHWDAECCFRLHVAIDYNDCTAPNLFRVQTMEGKTSAGTHIDSPAHCIPGGKTIDALDLEHVMADCVVIRSDDEADEQYLVMPEKITAFEKEHGKIAPETFVMFYTGWDKHWKSPAKYRNDLKFPSLHEDTAKLLLERNICGIGIDTLSPDARGEDFPVHRVLLSADKMIVENVANAGQLPLTGAKIIVAPMKIKDATEAPTRLFAVVGHNLM